MITIEAEDWNELVEILQGVRADLYPGEEGGPSNAKFEVGLQSLRSFHAMAAMLGIPELEQVGMRLEDHLKQQVEAGVDGDPGPRLDLALGKLIEEVQGAASGSNGGIDQGPVLDILERSVADSAPQLPDAAAGDGAASDAALIETMQQPATAEDDQGVAELEKVVAQLGGQLLLDPGDDGEPIVQLRFPARPASVEKITALLAKSDPSVVLASEILQEDKRLGRILGIISDFLQSLSTGDVSKAQDILLALAEQQHQAGLYNEIGVMARELHTSLKGFMDTLDPTLREMVQDRLPDSGNRLEHILELTENAANTTLDLAEAMQKRNHDDQERLTQLQNLFGGLQAVGDPARQQLESGSKLTEELVASALQTHDDVFAVLTAQDYQDLTGQIIQKIMKLLKELELKLVNVIQVFGVKVERVERAVAKDELYGPAYQGKAEALHSQDDVDALLADFGF